MGVVHEAAEIENALAEQAARQRRLLTELNQLILISGQPLAIQDLQEQLLGRTMAVLTADAGCIYAHDACDQGMRLVAHHGLDANAREHLAHMPPDWLVQDLIPCTVPDIVASSTSPSALRASGFQAYVGMPITLLGRVTGALTLFWVNPHSLSVEEIALFHTMVDQAGIIIENARLRQRAEEAAAVKERRRLARDLHDSVTQSLYSLVLATETASSRLQQGRYDLLAALLQQQAVCARQALREMRLLLFELRLACLDEVNLTEALNIRLEAVERKAGISVDAQLDTLTDAPKAVEREIYCIAMEALNNSLKHARAANVHVRLAQHQSTVELDIADDGCGFSPDAPRLGGLGLQSMKERAERLGAG